MPKNEIKTSLIGRKVRLGWSTTQMNEWAKQPANREKNLDCKIIPKCWEKHGQQEGTIVSVYLEANKPMYTVEREGDLMELSADSNFDILPA